MTQDIGPLLERVVRERQDWGTEQLAALLGTLVDRVSGGRSDWDWEAGERWGRVLVGPDVILVAHSRVPLAFVHSGYVDALSEQLADHRLQFVSVHDFDAPELTCAPEQLAAFAGREIGAGIEPERLSANDVWWLSV